MSARTSLALALLVLPAYGCAGALPTFQGGSVTPRYRYDVAGGGAARLPLGELRDDVDDPVVDGLREASGGGVAPVAYTRLGLVDRMDFGLMASGTTLRLDVRRERVLEEDTTRRAFVFAVAPFVGFLPDVGEIDGRGTRFGIDVPMTYGLDIGGVYDVWVGPRLAIEGIRGDFASGTTNVPVSMLMVRAGGVFGLAAGFRRVHAMFELGIDWEQQFRDGASRGGFVLTPAFALRVRI